jgi:hypothetical protein
MNDITDQILFTGGLDQDSDEKFIQQGDYVDAKNIITVEDGSKGIVINIKGNEFIFSAGGYGNYIYDLLGWTYYDRTNSVILFLKGVQTGSPVVGQLEQIIEYNPESDSSTVLIDDTDVSLGFLDPKTNDYYIDIKVAGDWLAWADNVNPPRMINIEDVRNGNITINEAYLDLHKKRPTASSASKHIPPLVSLGYDSDKEYNNLDTGYQFKYRFGYSDFRYSTWSPASDLAINRNLVRAGDNYNLLGTENYIDVQFNSGDVNVDYIDIAVREGNTGNWFRIIKIDKSDPEKVYSTGGVLQTSALSDDTDYDYRFYNNEGRIAVSNDEANKAYDIVPDTCETLSFIGDNRLVLGGCVEGKNLINIDVSLSAYDVSINQFESLGISSVTFSGNKVYVDFDLSNCIFDDNGEALAGDYVYFYYRVEVTLTLGASDTAEADPTYCVFPNNITGIDNIGNYLADNLTIGDSRSYNSSTNVLRITYQYPGYNVTGVQSPPYTTDSSLIFTKSYDLNTSTTGYVNDLGFSDGTTHKFALIYEDKYGVKYPALTSSDTEIEIEPISSGTTPKHRSISYTINNTAPSGAVAYRWAYAYKQKNFVQTIITDVSQFEDETGDLNTNMLALDVSGYSQIDNFGYTFESGDHIRIIREGGSYGSLGSYVDDAPFFVVEDVKSVINDGSDDLYGKWLIIKQSLVDGYSISNIGDPSKFMNAFIEVRKLEEQDQDYVFYEIGSGGYCVGGTTNHDDWFTGTNTGYLNQGDVWYRNIVGYRREASGKGSVSAGSPFGQSPLPYVNAPRRDVGIADVNVEFPESENKYFNIIRWSNNFIEDTKVNGLSTFDNLDRVKVSENHGKIKGLEELGDSLVVICEEKVLSSYVGATEYTDTQGNVNVVKSTTPLSYLRAHNERYGTFLKESIVNTGSYIYFYDLYNGVVVRKSKNGLYPISGRIETSNGGYDYKMRTFFKQISDDLVSTLEDNDVYDVKCFMGYDPYYENIYIKFLDRQTAANNKCLIFHEPSNRWIGEYEVDDGSNKSTLFPFTKKDIFSFIESDGGLYILNSDNVNRCNIYGLARSCYIQFVTHEKPNLIKVFNSIGIHADSQWTVDPIEGEANSNYPNGFYSKIIDSEFIKEEGVWRVAMPRNMKTRSSSATNYDRINGDEARGYVLKFKLTNSDTDEAKLFKVDINSIVSK